MSRTLASLLLAATTLSFASVAEAKGIPLPINTGDELFQVGPFPPEFAADHDVAGYQVGYKCSHFGLLWADVWTWDCQLAGVGDDKDSYADLPPDFVSRYAKDYPLSERKRGLWNHYAIPALVVGLLLFVGFGMVSNRRST